MFVGLVFGEGGVKAARGRGLWVWVVGLEEGALLQGVGICRAGETDLISAVPVICTKVRNALFWNQQTGRCL